MKVYVTQGHQRGIGLEVFFKTCLFLNSKQVKNLNLIAYKDSVNETLKSLSIPFKITDNFVSFPGLAIPVTWLNEVGVSQSFSCLEMGMKLCESGGVLYTLPTSKDQLSGFAGHTEYFRHFYNKPDLGMFFSSPDMQVLLVTDHVAVNQLSTVITSEKIERTLLTAHKSLTTWKITHERFLVAGLNPHAGEKGIIGNEDERISLSIKRLATNKEFEVSGPFSGDTMLLERNSNSDVSVYLFHDQGLGVFKGLQSFIGSNITLGLPYPRVSPDHGTSFGLYGKNQADYRGCRFSLLQALELLEGLSHGQNSSL